MYEGIRELCAVSLLCGAALSILPEGGVKRVAEILCTASLILAVISPIKEIDMDAYALESARLHELETSLAQQGQEAGERINRLVIEQEYEAYIMDKARELGVNDLTADVEVQWSMEGFWMPYGVKLISNCGDSERERLSQLLVSDLGIPYERQRWNSE